MTALATQAQALVPRMTALRRAIHAEPELGLHNPRTAARVRAELADLPLEWRESRTTSGLVAILRGPANGRTVLLRADTDALPMHEETGLPFASRVAGAMHACGHDSHTAMLAGAARLLAGRREQLAGTVMLMFQPGEEGHHGARFMLEEDGLIEPLPHAAFALHVMPNAPHGVFSGRAGPLMASADRIEILVRGAGGHASMPHDARDPVPMACELVLALQAVVTRTVPIADPAVLTIAHMKAGTTNNVIPDSVFLEGTMRTLSPARRAALKAAVRRCAEGVAMAHGMTVDVSIEEGFPVTRCDARAVALGRDVVAGLYGAEAWHDLEQPVMGAEDFSYLLEKVPGAMFFLGAAREGDDWRQCCALHSTRMMLDEAVMARGAALHAALAERFLADGLPDAGPAPG